MMKTVLGHSIYQLAIIFTLLHVPSLVPVDAGEDYVQKHGKLHLTMIFNSFVFMQIFNEINSRKINNERNVFDRIHTNKIFIGVIIITIVVQVSRCYKKKTIVL